MKGLAKRIARLERAEPDEQRPALVIIHGEGFDPDSMTGVDGIDLPRLDGERAGDYVARLGAHLRADRGRALPVCFAQYGPEDVPDGPSASALAAVAREPKPSALSDAE